MFPDFNYLKMMATFSFYVDFTFYLNLGNINEEQLKELRAINDKAAGLNQPTAQQSQQNTDNQTTEQGEQPQQ